MRRVLVLAFLAFFAGTAAARELAGVTMPEAVTVDGKALVLNGMGIRKATIFNIKVYVVGLYLESKSHSAADVLRSQQVKRFDVVLRRDVDRDDIIDAWRKGLKRNSADVAKLKSELDQFAGWMSDFAEGDTLTFLYVPGRGVTVFVKGKLKGTIAGADFAMALFAMWLGANPVDDGLKDGLLGN